MKGNKQVVLFNASHYGYVCRMMMYSLSRHKDDSINMILMDIGWASAETKQFLKNQSAIPGFDYFYLYDEVQLRKASSDDNLEKETISFFDKILKQLDFTIEDIDVVYTGFDTLHLFGVYLFNYKKHYSLFDINMTTSIPSNSPIFSSGKYGELMHSSNALSWDSTLVDKVIYTLGSSFEEINRLLVENNSLCKGRKPAENKLIEFFPISKSLSELKEYQIQEIIAFYNLSDYNSDSYSIVFLTSSFFLNKPNFNAHSDVMTREESFLYPYRLLIDYAKISDPIIVKAHPATQVKQELFNLMMPNMHYIPGYVPSEIVNNIGINFKYGISPGSNSITELRIDHSYSLPRSFFNYVDYIDDLIILSDVLPLFDCEYLINEYFPKDLTSDLSKCFLPSLTSDYSQKNLKMLYTGDKEVNNYTDSKYGAIGYRITEKMINEKVLGNPDYVLIILKKQIGRYSVNNGNYTFIGISTKKSINVKKYAYKSVLRISQLEVKAKIVEGHNTTELLAIVSGNKDVKNHVNNGIQPQQIVNDKTISIDEKIIMIRKYVGDPRYPKIIGSYLNLLWKKGTLASKIELLNYCRDNLDNPLMKAYYARLLVEGKIIEKDIEYAIILMNDAYENGISWIKYDLIEALWITKSTDNSRRMVEILTPLNDKDPLTYGWMARLYRDGEGVDVDVSLAKQYMKIAADANIKWAIKEYEKMNN